MTDSEVYDASAIDVIEGLDHIRRRPTMYIHDTRKAGAHQLIKEVLDNSMDEHLAGHATEICVRINTDEGWVEIEDNGRGIPVEEHPQTKISTLTTVMTVPNAGGKFGKQAYIFSAGLNGVGIKATNVFSEWLEIWVERDGGRWYQKFNRGIPKSDVKKQAVISKKTSSTRIRFLIDPDVFIGIKIDPKAVQRWLYEASSLCVGLKLKLEVDDEDPIIFENKEGLISLLTNHMDKQGVKPLHDPLKVLIEPENGTSGIDLAIVWSSGEGDAWFNYANLTPVVDGGTQVTGAKKAITKALNRRSKKTVYGDDLREGLVVALHVKVSAPEFKGQAKSRLQNSELEGETYDVVYSLLDKFFQGNQKIADQIISRAVKIREAREVYQQEKKALAKVQLPNRRKRGVLPGKLAEAPFAKPEDRELFIVEGTSAAGTAKKARNSSYQEILPLRGKIVNASRATTVAVLRNQEIQDIITAVGAGISTNCEVKKARIGKILLLMDADPDGQHISALLLGFIQQYMQPLIDASMVYVVDSPLFVAVHRGKRYYAHTLPALQTLVGAPSFQASRLKGHGESDPSELKEYAMDPATRKLYLVKMGKKDDELILQYMGQETTARKILLGLDT
jgi:DNA gyrase subunit B